MVRGTSLALTAALLAPAGAASSFSPEGNAPAPGQTEQAGQPPASAAAPSPDPDAEIEARLRAIFAQVEGLADVEVRVESGVVRLSGVAATAELIERIEQLAADMPGVVFVDNQVHQPEAVAERIAPAVQRLRAWWSGFVALLPLLGISLAILLVGFLASRAIRRWNRPFQWAFRNALVREIAQHAAALVLMLAVILVVLELLDATALVGAVLGAAGIVGLAVGFAFRDIAENYLASILLGVRRPFAANDFIRIESHEGKVARLTMRETTLVTLEGNHVRLPNSLVFKSAIVNYTTSPERRFDFRVTVAPRADLAAAQAAGVDALRKTPGVLDRLPLVAQVEEISEMWIALRFGGWVDQRQTSWEKVRSEAMRLVLLALEPMRPPVPVLPVPLPAGAPPAAPAPLPKPASRARPGRDAGADQARKNAADVAPETHIDEQVREEQAHHRDEEDLLKN